MTSRNGESAGKAKYSVTNASVEDIGQGVRGPCLQDQLSLPLP